MKYLSSTVLSWNISAAQCCHEMYEQHRQSKSVQVTLCSTNQLRVRNDTYTHTHIYTYTHTHIYTYTHIHIYTYTLIHINIYTYTHIHIYTYTHIHIHTYIHICTYTHIHIHTYTHIYIYAHIYIYTYTPACTFYKSRSTSKDGSGNGVHNLAWHQGSGLKQGEALPSSHIHIYTTHIYTYIQRSAHCDSARR